AGVIGVDNREPAISMVQMLNRSFIFNFLCSVGFSPGLPAKVGRENRLWLIGGPSRVRRKLPLRESWVRDVAGRTGCVLYR
ncbi:MAG TPA: hypothetical protein VHS80_06250, partial [Chthoniobacterales bacterium]|nr:hypothetical protein [Chthoniobacterales bacterium]